MAHLAALVAYDGTRYKGFQRQPAERGPTVQGALETAIARLAGEPVPIAAAGRTDRGVHAAAQVVTFDTRARHDPATWQRALNALLPEDIAVRALREAPAALHARRSAYARTYRYRILCDALRDPLRERYAWRVPRPLDVPAMAQAAALLLGEQDFGAFGSSPRDARAEGFRGHTVRTMLAADCAWQPARGGAATSDEVCCDFTANAFLTGMVRRLVSTLVAVGEGRLSVAEFRALLLARDKGRAMPPAPARGLCLVGVEYPAGLLVW